MFPASQQRISTDRPDDPTWNWGATYTAQVLDVVLLWGFRQHLIIRRHDGQEVITPWDTLQRIKNDMLGMDVWAVELFPAADDVVNEANWRHLWSVSTEVLPIGLRRR